MERVIEAASRIAAKYGADNLDTLAQQLGVAVYDLLETARLKELYFPNLKAIALRPGLPRHERRFLLAHGLGHHVLHRDGADRDFLKHHAAGKENSSPLVQSSFAKLENEADLFASYLLVPELALRPFLDSESIQTSDDPVTQLAIEFQVPTEAIRVRLVYEACKNRPN